MQLAHPGDDGLPGFVIVVGAEGGILALDGGERLAQFAFVFAGLGLDGHRDDRIGEDHSFEDDRLVDGA